MRRLALALLALFIGGPAGLAQPDALTFYLQNVPLWSQETDFSKGGFSNFYRFRIMSEPTLGDFSFLIAYEQVATFRQNEGLGVFVGAVPSGGEWLDLQWTVADEENVLWQHRFDRLQVAWTPSDALEVSVGRQPVSWATTLFLTPSDPFTPFNPADPFREFRAGIDAARVRVNPGPFSEIDVVVRPTKNDHLGEELTTLGRGLTTWKNWEISGWGGSLYGDVVGALGAAGSVGGTAIRGEGNVRSLDGDVVFRGTVGFDRRFSVNRKDVYIIAEYQHDGLGASSPDEYFRHLPIGSFPARRASSFGPRRGRLPRVLPDSPAVELGGPRTVESQRQELSDLPELCLFRKRRLDDHRRAFLRLRGQPGDE